MRCHSERSEESRPGLLGAAFLTQSKIPRFARNDISWFLGAHQPTGMSDCHDMAPLVSAGGGRGLGAGVPINRLEHLLNQEGNCLSIFAPRAEPNGHAACALFPASTSADSNRLPWIAGVVKRKVPRSFLFFLSVPAREELPSVPGGAYLGFHVCASLEPVDIRAHSPAIAGPVRGFVRDFLSGLFSPAPPEAGGVGSADRRLCGPRFFLLDG